MAETEHLGETEGSSEGPPRRSGRHVYNAVSDVVVGVNVRWKDNLFQALAIGICTLLGAGIGLLVVSDKITGVLAGGAIGVLVGLFGSGAFLMVYRALMHFKGRHD